MVRMFTGLAAGAALMLAAGTAAAQSQMPEGTAASDIHAAAAQIFDNAELKADDEGDPLIIALAHGTPFLIATYGCEGTGDKRCQVMRFLTWKEGPFAEEELRGINHFHNENVLGRVMIDDEQDLAVDWGLTLGDASAIELQQMMGIWAQAILPAYLEGFSNGQSQRRPQVRSSSGLEAMLSPEGEVSAASNKADKRSRLKAIWAEQTAAPERE